MDRVIVKAFAHYHYNVIVTDRHRAMFTSKLWKMSQAHGGGTKWHGLKNSETFKIQCSVLNRKQENLVIVSTLNQHAILEAKFADTTKK